MWVNAKIVNKDTMQVDVDFRGIHLAEEGYKLMYVIQKADYLYYVKNISESFEEILSKINKLEQQYGMTRVMREHIIKNPEGYSEFNVQRATEIEQLAEMLRKN